MTFKNFYGLNFLLHTGEFSYESTIKISDLRVTIFDAQSAWVIMRSLVEQLHTVALSNNGRGEVNSDHL